MPQGGCSGTAHFGSGVVGGAVALGSEAARGSTAPLHSASSSGSPRTCFRAAARCLSAIVTRARGGRLVGSRLRQGRRRNEGEAAPPAWRTGPKPPTGGGASGRPSLSASPAGPACGSRGSLVGPGNANGGSNSGPAQSPDPQAAGLVTWPARCAAQGLPTPWAASLWRGAAPQRQPYRLQHTARRAARRNGLGGTLAV